MPMIETGETLIVRGIAKVVVKYRLTLSMCQQFEHSLWVLWEGETKYERFDSVGHAFADIDRAPGWVPAPPDPRDLDLYD